MADIDNLKQINDTYGHLFGEFVVGEVGRIIQDSLHSEELYATRFGGDEYQAILPRLDKEEAVEVAEEIRRRVEEYVFERDGVCANPTISLGAASYPEDGATRDYFDRSRRQRPLPGKRRRRQYGFSVRQPTERSRTYAVLRRQPS